MFPAIQPASRSVSPRTTRRNASTKLVKRPGAVISTARSTRGRCHRTSPASETSSPHVQLVSDRTRSIHASSGTTSAAVGDDLTLDRSGIDLTNTIYDKRYVLTFA